MVVSDDPKVMDDSSLLYFGSHNFSPSAWGNLGKNGSQIYIANWELGVVFPPSEGSKEMKKRIIETMAVNMNDPEKYKDGEMPFIL